MIQFGIGTIERKIKMMVNDMKIYTDEKNEKAETVLELDLGWTEMFMLFRNF